MTGVVSVYNGLVDRLGRDDALELETRSQQPIPKSVFEQMLAQARTRLVFVGTERTKVDSVSRGRRKTVRRVTDLDTGEVGFQVKSGELTESVQGSDLRVSVSLETNIKHPDVQEREWSHTRSRERTVFSVTEGGLPFFVFFTAVDNAKHEVEVEYDPSNRKHIRVEVVEATLRLAESLFPFSRPRVAIEFNTLIGRQKSSFVDYPLSKPTDLSINELRWEFMSDFCVTTKADGVRAALYFTGAGVFRVARDIEKVSDHVSATQPSVLEAEYIQQSDSYLVFDCLAIRGESLSQRSIADRLSYASEVAHTDALSISVKPYLFYKNVGEYVEAVGTLTDSISNKAYEIDGLIFQSLYGFVARKWKPKLTIDFTMVREEPFVGAKDEENRVVPFRPKGGVANSVLGDLKVGEIGEFEFNGSQNRFEFVRKRPDKVDPNFTKVAMKVFNLIINPITEETLRLDNLVTMRKYHNREKSDVYSALGKLKVGSVLDIGSGTGGDVAKWVDNSLTVTAVEKDKGNYARLVERVKTLKAKATPVNSDFLEYSTNRQFNAVTSFNSLTFFGGANMGKFFDRVDRLIGIGGFLALTYVSGDRFEVEFPRPSYKGKSISVDYVSDKQIKITIDASGIVTDQTETLIMEADLEPFLVNYSVQKQWVLDTEPMLSVDGMKLSRSTVVKILRKAREQYKGDTYTVLEQAEYPMVKVVQDSTDFLSVVLGSFYKPYISSGHLERRSIATDVSGTLGKTDLKTVSKNLTLNVVVVSPTGEVIEKAEGMAGDEHAVVMREGNGTYNLIGKLNRGLGVTQTLFRRHDNVTLFGKKIV